MANKNKKKKKKRERNLSFKWLPQGWALHVWNVLSVVGQQVPPGLFSVL